MRFENLLFPNNIRVLKRLHKRLNKELFDGQLNDTIKIDICNLHNGLFKTSEKAVAGFCVPNEIIQESILFDNQFIDDIAAYPTQKLQAIALTHMMLHEMIHQYCYETGIDDHHHGEAWQQAAEEHGLHIKNEEASGDYSYNEFLKLRPCFIADTFRIR